MAVVKNTLKAIRKFVFSGLVIIGLCVTYISSASDTDNWVPRSLSVLNNIAELSAFETQYHSVLYIDTRPYKNCLLKSVKGGLCLSPDQLSYPDGTLASFRDINWLIGTYGVSADSVLVVVGGSKESKYMVAAVLYLLGVREVAIWESDFASIVAVKESGSGQPRGILRSEYFSLPMRDDRIALDSDLQQVFETDKDASIQKLASTEFAGHLISTQIRSPIITGKSPSAALINFTDQMLTQTNTLLRVHTNGLGSRTFSDFGYTRPGYLFALVIVVLALFAVGTLGYWRKSS